MLFSHFGMGSTNLMAPPCSQGPLKCHRSPCMQKTPFARQLVVSCMRQSSLVLISSSRRFHPHDFFDNPGSIHYWEAVNPRSITWLAPETLCSPIIGVASGCAPRSQMAPRRSDLRIRLPRRRKRCLLVLTQTGDCHSAHSQGRRQCRRPRKPSKEAIRLHRLIFELFSTLDFSYLYCIN